MRVRFLPQQRFIKVGSGLLTGDLNVNNSEIVVLSGMRPTIYGLHILVRISSSKLFAAAATVCFLLFIYRIKETTQRNGHGLKLQNMSYDFYF